jgi:hypothetical protein
MWHFFAKGAKLHGGNQNYDKLPPRTLKNVDPFNVVQVNTLMALSMVYMFFLSLTKPFVDYKSLNASRSYCSLELQKFLMLLC